jgi:DNA-binding CsgD family transcriptional regulator
MKKPASRIDRLTKQSNDLLLRLAAVTQGIKAARDELHILLDGAQKLTAREREVLAEVRRGAANKEISARLNISYRTVKFHVGSLMDKFGTRNRQNL